MVSSSMAAAIQLVSSDFMASNLHEPLGMHPFAGDAHGLERLDGAIHEWAGAADHELPPANVTGQMPVQDASVDPPPFAAPVGRGRGQDEHHGQAEPRSQELELVHEGRRVERPRSVDVEVRPQAAAVRRMLIEGVMPIPPAISSMPVDTARGRNAPWGPSTSRLVPGSNPAARALKPACIFIVKRGRSGTSALDE